MILFIIYLTGIILTSLYMGVKDQMDTKNPHILGIMILLWPLLVMIGFAVFFGLVVTEYKKQKK